MKSPIRARHNSLDGLDLGVVLLVAAIGLALAFQGWNSRLMNFDHVNFIAAASQLLSDGILPDRGDVSSYFAFATPGTAWLLVPGMLVFEDPRLYEAVGSAGLYIGTLFGLLLLARMCFGNRCAYLSVLLYGLSRNGLFHAGSLWSIGHPFFYVWMVYFCLLWVQRNNSNYLAAAAVMWSAGMYVDMVLAPAIFAIPAIWVIYRPQLRVAPLLLGALTVLAIWYPFLRFESGRNFVDLKAVVARQSILQIDYKDSWCNPTLVVRSLTEPSGVSGVERRFASLKIAAASAPPSPPTWLETVKKQIRLRSTTLKEGLVFNFDQMTFTPLTAIPLSLLALATLLASAAQGSARLFRDANNRNWVNWIRRVAWMLLFLPIVVNEAFIARFLSTRGILDRSLVLDIRMLQAGSLLAGVALLRWRRQVATLLHRMAVEPGTEGAEVASPGSTLLALALVVPWLALIMVVEVDRAERYFWMMPVQLMLIVAAVTWIPERLGWPRSVAWLAQACLTLLLLTHPWVMSPVQAWARNGWSGPRAIDIQAVDYIASQVRAQARSTVAIGYHTYIAGFMAMMNVADPRYKVGAELDLFLKYRYGISNSNQCAEGVSATDEYRIVQKPPPPVEPKNIPNSWTPLGSEVKTYDLVEYFDVPLDPSFRPLGQFGDFQVFHRDPP